MYCRKPQLLGAQPRTEPEECIHPYIWLEDSLGTLIVRTVIASRDAITFFDYCVRAGFVVRECFWPILLKKSASISTAEKYASEIEIRVLSRRFRAQI
jgi:hypothetical protein